MRIKRDRSMKAWLKKAKKAKKNQNIDKIFVTYL